MTARRQILLALIAAMLAATTVPAAAVDPLRGHGGPVRAIARLDANRIATAGFDQTIIIWSAARTAQHVLRLHDGAVNALVAIDATCLASGGEDGRIAIWCGDAERPARVLEGHTGPVSALVVTNHGRHLVSGAFDRRIRVWDIATGRALTVYTGHDGPVTSLALMPGGEIVSGSFDASVRIWSDTAGQPAHKAQLPAPVTALSVAADGEIAAAGSDGHVRFLTPSLEVAGELAADVSPIGALALSPDGATLAAAGLKGGVALIERTSRAVRGRLVGPGLPVWSLAFGANGDILLTGGADRLVRFWDVKAGAPLSTLLPEPDDPRVASEERGAIVFRACRACHTLTPDDGNRAGPTLFGIVGRRVGTAPGYTYSPSMAALDIVWTPETIQRLFELGPAAYTPGSKMPEQTITDPADRAALAEWLARQTAPR